MIILASMNRKELQALCKEHKKNLNIKCNSSNQEIRSALEKHLNPPMKKNSPKKAPPPKKTSPAKNKSSEKKCPPGKILNPASGRCVDVNGVIGRTLTKKPSSPKCPEGKIFNPKSGRCVNESGAVGRALRAEKNKEENANKVLKIEKCIANIDTCKLKNKFCNLSTGNCDKVPEKRAKNIKVSDYMHVYGTKKDIDTYRNRAYISPEDDKDLKYPKAFYALR